MVVQPPTLSKPSQAAPPTFEKLDRNARLVEGGNAVFELVIRGTPTPTVIWTRKGAPIKDSPKFQVKYDLNTCVCSLLIRQLLREDEGEYTCTATNQYGEAICTVFIQAQDVAVQQKPTHEVQRHVQQQVGQTSATTSSVSQQKTMHYRQQRTVQYQQQQTTQYQQQQTTQYQQQQQQTTQYQQQQQQQQTTQYQLQLQQQQQQQPQQQQQQTSSSTRVQTHYERTVSSGRQVEQPSTGYYTNGTVDETFKVDTFEYRLLREVEFRESKTRRYTNETDTETEQDTTRPEDSGPTSAPQIQQRPRNSKLLEGSDATFQAKISGNPRSRITWFKNGVRITPSQRYQISYKNYIATLHIRLVLPEDTGHYTLLAENDLGCVVCSSVLSVEAVGTKDEYRFSQPDYVDGHVDGVGRPVTPSFRPYSTTPQPEVIETTPTKSLKPNFVKIPTDKEVTEGKWVRFDLRITGRPYPEILWYLNDKIVEDDVTHKLIVNEAGNHSLMITSTSRNDAGTYTCVARNKGGSVSFTVNLTVIEKEQVLAPKFVERFQTMHVKAGEPVSLHCRAVGSPIPRITWQKDGVHIMPNPDCEVRTDGGSSSLYIRQATHADSSWYQCTAQNVAGSTATRARLYVESEPTLQSEPWRLNLPRPTKVIHPEGSPEREIIWLRHVERARPYQTNKQEDRRIRSPPMFTHPLKDQPAFTDGESVHFEARLVPIEDPTMTIEWFFNGKPLQVGSRFMTQYRFGYVTLTIINVSFTDAGIYSCRAVNELGEATTKTTITVTARTSIDTSSQYPASLEKIQALEDWEKYHRQVSEEELITQRPLFVRELNTLSNLREGQLAHFEAQVTPLSDPTMKIEWYFNGRSLQASSRITTIYNFGYVALNIMHIRTEDAGTYVCKARNRVGEATSTTTLTITVGSRGVVTDTGLEEQSRYMEKIDELEAYQKSTYIRSTEETTLETKPRFLTELNHQVNIPEGQTAHFEARLEPVGDPNLKVVWLKDGKPLEASSRITTFFNFGYVALTIKNVYIHDIATYTCKATNNKGTATTTARLTIVTSKGVVLDSQYPEGLEKLQHLEDTSRYSRQVMEETMIKQLPKFTTPLSGPNKLPEGQAAHFETRLEPQNDSTMTVEWFLNGKPLQTGHRFKTYFDFGYVALDILYVYPEDSGLFTVKATNSVGTATQTIELTIYSKTSIDTSVIHKVGMEKIQHLEDSHFVEPRYDIEEYVKSKPYFTIPLKDHPPMKESGHIHMECRLEPCGDPTMRVEWFFNGRPLTVGSRFKTLFDFGYVALDITTAYPEDTGEYTVRATNHLGSAHTSACVQIIGKKSIDYDSQYPQSVDKIQALEDSSRYHRERHEEEIVSQLPTFTKPLHNLEGMEGTNVHLECRLQPVNDSTMTVEWYFNGQPVKTGHRFRPAHDFDYVALDVLSVYAEDSGIYICKATNHVGQAVTTASVKITAKSSLILESQHPQGLEKIQHLEDTTRYHRDMWSEEMVKIPPRFLNKFKDLELREGQNAHFECRLEPVTDPTLKVEWYKNTRTLTVGSRFRPLHDFGYVALDILGVVSEDTGVYTCRATNAVGADEMTVKLVCLGGSEVITESQHQESLEQIQYLEDTSRYHREMILEEVTKQAPVFTSSIHNIEIKEGQRAHFECRLIPVSDPNLKVEWLHNGQPVKSGSRFSETNNFGFVSLDILTAYSEDSGTYTCRAINPLGSATTSATLKCHAKRSIYLDTQHEEALEQIQFLEDPTRHARAGYGDELHIQAPVFTQPMRNLELEENKSAHFETRLIPTADPNLRVEWFRNGLPLEAGTRLSTLHDFGFVALDLAYVRPGDSGTYSCKASNDLGTAVTSATLHVQGKGSLILETQNPEGLQRIQQLEDTTRQYRYVHEDIKVTKAPRFITPLTGPTQLVEAQSTHMECRVEPFPDPDLKVEWFFNGRPLQVGHRFRTLFDFGFVALDIVTVYPEDAGEYTVRATNKLGTASSSLRITVKAKGSLILETQNPEGLQKIQALEDGSRYQRQTYTEAITTERPQFGRPLRNLENLTEGQAAHLESIVTPVNDPTMKVEWFVNGRPISQGHRFKTTFDFGFVALDVLYIYPEDSGTYMCKATNAVGEAVTTCSIRVEGKRSVYLDTLNEEGLRRIQELETVYQRPKEEIIVETRRPEFLAPLVSQNIQEGKSVHLETRLVPVHDPNLKVEWFVNGVEIKAAHRFRPTHDFGYVAMDILYAYPEDSGNYMCKATNKMGEAVTTCNITVQSHRSIYFDTQNPEGWQKIRELEAQPKHRPVEVQELPITKPLFLSPLIGKQDLMEGENSHLECRVEPVHDPQLIIEFFHDGSPLEAASRFHVTFDFGYVALDIAHVFPEDAGEYTVRAKNELGEASSSIIIRIQAKSSIILDSQRPEGLEQIMALEDEGRFRVAERPVQVQTFQRPMFTQPLQNLDNLMENDFAHLEARVIPVGDPKLKIEWFFNNQLLQPSSRITTVHDFGYVAMDVQYMRSEDTGVYRCRASNDLGEAVTTASVKVRSKASIIYDTKHPEGLEKIRELEDTQAAPRPEAPELVYEKPVFTTTLTGPTDLWEGQPAHYMCRVIPVGDPSLRFEWYINGIELRLGTRLRTTNDFGMVMLDIAHTIPEDSGVYMCKAINRAGEAVTSISLKVRGRGSILSEPFSEEALQQVMKFEDDRSRIPEAVSEPAPRCPVFITHLENQERLAEGQLVHLEARVEPTNDEKLRIEWYKNSVPLNLGTRMRNVFDFGLVTLDISGVRPDDAGIYTCRAVNDVGEAVSTCTLRVEGGPWLIGGPQRPESLDQIRLLELVPEKVIKKEFEPTFDGPIFITQLNNIQCREGEFARFECQVGPYKDPTLTIEFFLNGKPLPLATKFTVTNEFGNITLDISHAYPEDAGIYVCKAKNRKGQASTSGSLKVSSKKSIIYDTQHPMGLEGLEKVQEVEEAFISKYEGRPLDMDIPYPKPIFIVPLEPTFAINEGNGLHMEARVEPSADPKLTIEWFLNGKSIEMGSRYRFLHDFGHVVFDVSDMWPRDSGIYTCRAKNPAGEAFTTTTIHVTGKGGLYEGTLHPKGQEGLERIQDLEESLGYIEGGVPDEEGQPPKFTSQFENLASLTEGDIAHFEASLTPAGDQTMVVEWFFNGEPLKAGHRIRTVHAFGMVVLEILGVYIEDSGEYTCRATNKWGRAQITVSLECVDHSRGQKPHFTTHIQSLVNLKEGQSAHFECNLIPVGDPAMKVEWFHNKKPLRDSSRIKTLSDFGFVVMDIAFVHAEDSGEYVCRASNKYGEDFTKAAIMCEGPGKLSFDSLQPHSLDFIAGLEGAKYDTTDVYVEGAKNQPPHFETQIQSLDRLIEGQSAHFEARLTPVNDPHLKVDWYFNGTLMQTGHRFRTFHDFGIVILDILYCYAEDSGVYEARAVNRFGQDITRATIKCYSKASLIFDTQLPKEMEGGLEKIQYLEDALYRSRRHIDLEGRGQAPVFTVPLENVSGLREGENAHLEARLTPVDDPRLKVEWYFNGKAIKKGSRIRVIHDFSFVVMEVSPVYPEDSGEYCCRAKNDYGEAVTTCTLKCEGKRSIILESQLPKEMESGVEKIAILEGYNDQRIPEMWMDVEESQPPRFITQPPDLTLMENSTAHFECRLTPISDPSMNVSWFHNGKPLSHGSRIKSVNDFGYVILEVAGVYPRDAGLYTCKASNRHGEATVSCKLTVKSKLGIIMEPQLPSDFKTGTESLQRLEESLYRREEPLPDDEKPHPPIFITQIQDLLNLHENDPAHFECRVEPVGDSSMRIEWFLNGRPLDFGSRVHTIDDFGFVVLDVDWTFPRDTGEYVCRATNRWGTASTRAQLVCKGKRDIIVDSQLPKGMNADKLRELECPPSYDRTAEELPLQPPKFTTQIQPLDNLHEGDSAHFECRLIPVNDPKLKVEWFHNGEPLMSGHRFKTSHDFGYVALDIMYVYAEDGGEYVAKASNDLGQDVTKTTLQCKSSASIILYNQMPRDLKHTEVIIQMEATIKKYTQEVHLGPDDIYNPEKGQPPRFVTQIQSLTNLKEMQNAKFECQLAPVGDPNMKVEWFFNGRPLSFKNRFNPIYDCGYVALEFAWVYPQDSGEYVCRATNQYGCDETRAILQSTGTTDIVSDTQLPKGMRDGVRKIQEMEAGWQRIPEDEEDPTRPKEPPVFVLKLEPCIVEEGDWAKFRCRVTGHPRPRIMWLLNGHTIVTGSRYKLSYDGMYRMDIPKSRQYDAGNVEVIARNSMGEAYCATTLEVRPRLDDYRALLKRSPRPWYDTKVKTYQEERKGMEVERKFEEHLDETKSYLYHVDEDTREHLCTSLERDDSELQEVFKQRRLEAQGIYIQPGEDLTEEEKQKRLEESITLVQGIARNYDEIVEPDPSETPPKKSRYRTRKRDHAMVPMPGPSQSTVHGKEVHTQKQMQTQKETKGDLEINRKTTLTETVEQEHKGTTQERLVRGKLPETKPPVFTKKLQPCRAFEGQSATFDCEFTGLPDPTVTWYRENFPIKNSADFHITTTDKRTTLFIKEVYMEDSGVFSVLAQNRGGTAKTNTNLVVEERKDKPSGFVPPSFLVTIQDANVKAGQLIRLDAKVTGTKPLDVYWLKNGQKILPDIRYKMLEEDDNYTLLVIEAFPEDIGTYECVAINQCGEGRCQAQVYVEAPPPSTQQQKQKPTDGRNAKAPSILQPLKDMSVNEGQPAKFQCRVTGQPLPQVQWYRGENPIKPSRYFRMTQEGDTFNLYISEAFPEDEGTYKCVAQNPAGVMNLNANLRVLVPEAGGQPPNVVQFRDVSIVEGRPARFITDVNGSPMPTVQWLRESVVIPQSQDFQMMQEGNRCTLAIMTTFVEDSGRYTCRATNPSGQAEASANLRVERTKNWGPVKKRQAGSGPAPVPAAQVAPDVPLVSKQEIILKPQTKPLTRAQQQQQQQQQQKPQEQPKVQPKEKPKEPDEPDLPPKFIQDLKSIVVGTGKKAMMECFLEGKPVPDIAWYREKTLVQPKDPQYRLLRASDGRCRFEINESKPEHTGTYTCKASNPLGQVETSAKITVEAQDVPKITKRLKATTGVLNGSVELNVEAEGTPQPVVQWFHEGKEILQSARFQMSSENGHFQLVINQLMQKDAGRYEARALSRAGRDSSTGILSVLKTAKPVEAKPCAPIFLKPLAKQTVKAGKSATLEVEVASEAVPTFRWYRRAIEVQNSKDFQVITTGNKSRLVLKEVFEDDGCQYSCTAINPIGPTTTAAQLIVEPSSSDEEEEEEEEESSEEEEEEEEKPRPPEKMAPKFKVQLANLKVMDGEEINWKCEVVGKPMPQVKWSHNGREVKEQKDIKLTMSPDGCCQLHINEVFPEDSGQWECKATNDVGEVTTRANLLVDAYEYVPDSEIASISAKSASSGTAAAADDQEDTAANSGSDDDIPDDIPVDKSVDESSEASSMAEDSGDAGFAPKIITGLRNASVRARQSVRFACQVNGQPQPKIQWYCRGRQVKPGKDVQIQCDDSGNCSLLLRDIRPDNAGEIMCEARNNHGVDISTATLSVQGT